MATPQDWIKDALEERGINGNTSGDKDILTSMIKASIPGYGASTGLTQTQLENLCDSFGLTGNDGDFDAGLIPGLFEAMDVDPKDASLTVDEFLAVRNSSNCFLLCTSDEGTSNCGGTRDGDLSTLHE